LNDNYIRSCLRKFRIKYGREPRSILVSQYDYDNTLPNIYHSTHGVFAGFGLYGVPMGISTEQRKGTVKLLA
jgi:hypothetical protein